MSVELFIDLGVAYLFFFTQLCLVLVLQAIPSCKRKSYFFFIGKQSVLSQYHNTFNLLS